ncbi:hypothetical protein P691DRAFT_380521 [Macrolepiota fuliginosa MF-IS2]|uniref:Uncharacterized protein n=1 Tax=Macrolepiota fuliginosa MF-IS2 TaxID=1400762 RepID=A0A9P6C7G8_9AGAR|nr:hypothetical protein P691DRAFT_380521 [Macrolepiota fuliginosa MF-IS2]
MAIAGDTEWTTSRIQRLLRPLKCKCLALSAYMKETSTGMTTYGSRRSSALLPLKTPLNIGIRIHLSGDTIRSLELSKRIYAIRDCYSDLVSKMDRSRVDERTDTPALSSLTSLCSVILGAQIPCSEEGDTESETSLDMGEVLYDAIPSTCRLRTLLMHALHIILDSCPPHASLYLGLLDVSLTHQLYHESEVLLDATLEHALECSQDSLPPISDPAHRGFLVNLYCKWNTQFPSATFIRLVTAALRRAPSDVVWISKATRRLARKLARHDINLLPTLLSGLMDTVLVRQQRFTNKQPETGHLEILREWLDMGTEDTISTLRQTSGSHVVIENESLIGDMLDHCRSWVSRFKTRDNEDLSGFGFIDAIVCFYTLWLVSGTRNVSKHDVLHILSQQILFSSTIFTPICNKILRERDLVECESILWTFSSVLQTHGLLRLNASFWACALYQVEQPEIEKALIDKAGREQVRKVRLRLTDYVDEAEGWCFAGAVDNPVPRGNREPVGPGATSQNDEAGETPVQWVWEPAVGCWFRGGEGDQADLPGPPKRRKMARHSYPSSDSRTSSEAPSQSRSTGVSRRYHDDSEIIPHSQTCNSSHTPPVEDIDRQPSFQFTSLLSNALSSRTNLRGEHERTKRQRCNSAGKMVAVARVTDSDGSDDGYAVDSGDGDDLSLSELCYEEHASSEDFLDLFRLIDASPVG